MPPAADSPLPDEVGAALAAGGNTFGRYVRTARLGAGGMGEVWKAWDRDLARWVALKFLKGDDPEELARFTREAQTAAQLNHPNIAGVFEVGDAGGKNFIAMQYVPGRTLRAAAQEGTAAVVKAVIDAARAVHHAHQHGVIHRDLKPDNIMVETATGRVYVMDFGLAKRVSTDRSLTMSGMMLGTPAYMPPEQARGDVHQIDTRSDVYSLGATLYDLLAGRAPFQDETLLELLMKVVSDDPPPLPAKVDRDLATIVLKSLEKDPVRRYPAAAAFADDLQRWLDGDPIEARPPSTLYRLRKRLAKRKALSAAIACVVVVALAGAGLLLRGSAESHRREQWLKRVSSAWMTIVESKRDLRQLRRPAADARARLEESIRAVDPLILEYPHEPAGYVVRARGLMYLGRLPEARESARKAVDLRPSFRPGWELLVALCVADTFEVADWRPPRKGAWGFAANPAIAEAVARMDAVPPSEEGLGRTSEDEVLRTIVEAQRHTDVATARRALEEASRTYRAEEYAITLGVIAEGAEARRWYAQAAEWGPGFAQAWFELGNWHLTRKEWADAVRHYDRAIELRPDYAGAFMNRGVARRGRGDGTDAIRDYDRAIELQPRMAMGFVNRGAAREAHGDLAAAMTDVNRAIELAPDMPEARFNRYKVKTAGGDLDGALRDLDDAIALKVKFGIPDARYHFSRGLLNHKRDHVEAAIRDYDRALELDPVYAQALVNRAVLHVDRKNLDKALADLDKAIALTPDDAFAWFHRAEVKLARRDADGAVRDFDATIRLRPDLADPYLRRGIALRDLGNVQAALRSFDSYVTLKPSDPEAWFYRGHAKQTLGDAAGAERDYDRTIQLRADHHPALVNRGNLKKARGDVDAAILDFDKAIAARADNAEAFYNRGDAHLSQGRAEDAIEDFNRAIKLKPDFAEALGNRGNARKVLGDLRGTADDWEAALRVAPATWRFRAALEKALKDVRKELDK